MREDGVHDQETTGMNQGGNKCWLLRLADMRGVFVAIENPVNSFLWRCNVMEALRADLELNVVQTCLGMFGATTLKPLCLWVSHSVGLASVYIGASRSSAYELLHRSGCKDTLSNVAPRKRPSSADSATGWRP
eukprot:9474912-Pyramimonas_sp.AAC.3